MSAGADPAFEAVENLWILLADGRRLAARLWLPAGARARPAPAVVWHGRKSHGRRIRTVWS